MSAPKSLTGVATSVSIDGVDLHEYGMVVNNVENPVPQARQSVTQIFGRHGDFDYTKTYGVRSMTLTGTITADTNADLLGYIDSLKTFFRLRENDQTFKVVFHNQTDRYWTCKYQGQFSIRSVGPWKIATKAQYSLALKCVKPFAEATNVSTVSGRLSTHMPIAHTYAGNVPTPFGIDITPESPVNLLDLAAGGIASQDHTLWTYLNATGSTMPWSWFNTNVARMTGTGAGSEYYAYIDVTSVIDTSKYYVFSVYPIGGNGLLTYLDVWMDGASGTMSLNCYRDWPVWRYDWRPTIKVAPSDMSGLTYIRFRVRYAQANTLSTEFQGAMIHEITQAQYNDSTYWGNPYSTNTSTYKAPTAKPKIRLITNNNLLPEGKGDDVTNWGKSTQQAVISYGVVPDPFDHLQKCIKIACKLNGASPWAKVYGPHAFVKQYTNYRYQWDMYIEILDGVQFDLRGRFSAEPPGWSYYNKYIAHSYSAPTSGWGTYSYNFNSDLDQAKFNFEIYSQWGTTTTFVVYFKNIMLIETSATTDQPFTEHDAKVAQWGGTLEDYDSVSLDFEKLLAVQTDMSAAAIQNAMGDFSGDRLLLKKGINTMVYHDYRETASSNLGGVSSGLANFKMAYRARFL